MQEELKPCPFCGGKAATSHESLDERYAYANRVKVQCTVCGVSVSANGDTSKPGYADNSTTEMRAITAWNRRTPVSGEVAEVAMICGECGIDRLKSGCQKPDCFMTATAYASHAAQGIDHAKLAGERVAFEGWYTQNYTDWIPRSLLDTEEYGNLDTQLAWRAWQARGQQAGAAIPWAAK